MPVVINEFDVAVQRDPEESAPAASAQPAQQQSQPEDLRDTLRQLAERKARLCAH